MNLGKIEKKQIKKYLVKMSQHTKIPKDTHTRKPKMIAEQIHNQNVSSREEKLMSHLTMTLYEVWLDCSKI